MKFAVFDPAADLAQWNLQEQRDLFDRERGGLRPALFAERRSGVAANPNNADFMRFDFDLGSPPRDFFHRFKDFAL